MTEATKPSRAVDPQFARELVAKFLELLLDPARSEQARPLMTREYIQHNPNIPSGPDGIIAFTKTPEAERAQRLMRPAPEPPTYVVEGDRIVMMLPRDLPDPTDPSKTYRSYWFDMWRIEDGKLAEHWDSIPKEQ